MTSNNYDSVVKTLSSFISGRLINIPNNIKEKVQEIRLRVNRPITLSCPDEIYYITVNGCISNTPLSSGMLTLNRRDISEIFNNLCSYSVYSKQNEIINGFITIKGGHRAGICGTAISDNSKIINIRDISSINIRVANEQKDCSKDVLNRISNVNGGILLCGSPCSGKTTILRDLARVLSTSYSRKIAVIDSRSEIAGTYKGVFQMDVGMCDILDGYSKKDGFSHSLRCMSPDIIICDEIGNSEDIISIENAMNCGVSIIASAHCSNKKELLQKDNLKGLIKTGGFKNIVFLENRKKPGTVLQVFNSNELLS